jgi:hypothetical protein
MRYAPLFGLISLSALSWGQNATTGKATTSGPCSPAVTGNGNIFYFRYCGNDPEERVRIMKLLTAVSEGQDLTNAKLDQILELLGAPPKIFVVAKEQETTPPEKAPKASITFYTEDPIGRGQFEVHCDRPCSPVDTCSLMGGNQSLLATVSTSPDLAEFFFRREFPNLTKCKLTVESRDMNPVSIIGIAASRRMENIVPNKIQPPPRVWANGSTIQ